MTASVTVQARTSGGTGTGAGTGTGTGAGQVGMPRTGAGSDWQLLAMFGGLLIASAGLILRRRDAREHAN